MNTKTAKLERYKRILLDRDKSPAAIVFRVLMEIPKVRHLDGQWFAESRIGARIHKTYGNALRERSELVIKEAARLAGGLEKLNPEGFAEMPATMRKMAEARLRAKTGAPRKTGWKWSAESRAKLSKARTGVKDSAPRKRGYPLFTLAPGFPLPESGHRFTVTRETLAEIRAMVFPEGM